MEENGHQKTPYEEMRELLEQVNQDKRRSEQWTASGKDPEQRILAMDKNNDPYYSGQEWQKEAGEWFAEFHRRRVGERRLHIRALFYIATGEDPSPETGVNEATYLPDGRRFEKTAANWEFMQFAAKTARNMELIDASLVIDRKRSRVEEYGSRYWSEPPAPYIEYTEPDVTLPSVNNPRSSVEYAQVAAQGYDRHSQRVPSLVEVWTEKDLDEADAPVLEEVCRSMSVNLVIGTGYFTISSAHALLKRQAESDKPVRILFLSDFDDAGEHMPVSPARHIEFAIRNMDPRPDIRLHHLALTAEQVVEQDIPRKIPTKKEENKLGRLANWEERRGVGTVELNTLTDAARQGYFRRLLRGAILALRDTDIDRKLGEAQEEADRMLLQEARRRMHWPHKALEKIAAHAQEVASQFEEERADLRRRMDELLREQLALDHRIDEALESLEDRAERVRQVARRRLTAMEEEMELPKVEPEEAPGVTEGWLYDSRRDYFEQLHHYRKHKSA